MLAESKKPILYKIEQEETEKEEKKNMESKNDKNWDLKKILLTAVLSFILGIIATYIAQRYIIPTGKKDTPQEVTTSSDE
jgi:hypothetical protein